MYIPCLRIFIHRKTGNKCSNKNPTRPTGPCGHREFYTSNQLYIVIYKYDIQNFHLVGWLFIVGGFRLLCVYSEILLPSTFPSPFLGKTLTPPSHHHPLPELPLFSVWACVAVGARGGREGGAVGQRATQLQNSFLSVIWFGFLPYPRLYLLRLSFYLAKWFWIQIRAERECVCVCIGMGLHCSKWQHHT